MGKKRCAGKVSGWGFWSRKAGLVGRVWVVGLVDKVCTL